MQRDDYIGVLRRICYWGAALIGGLLTALAAAKDLGVTQCVEAMWDDFDQMAALARNHIPRADTPYAGQKKVEKKGKKRWLKIRAYERHPESDVAVPHLYFAADETKRRIQYFYEVDLELSDTPVATPLSTPAPTPAPRPAIHSPGSPSLSLFLASGASPQGQLSANQLARLREVITKSTGTVLSPDKSSSSDSPISNPPPFERLVSMDSEIQSPLPPYTSGNEDGVLFIRKLQPGGEYADLSLLKPGQSRNGKEKGLICSAREVDVDGEKEHFYLCCAFDDVDETPDFAGLKKEKSAREGEDETDSESDHLNKLITDFFETIEKENQYVRKMYKVGDIMQFRYRERTIGAKIVGVGTSTVVFQFGRFSGDDSDPIIKTLNEHLPDFAFRRIFFTSALNAMLFYFHQLAQVKFLNEYKIKILPVKLWKADARSRSVLIAQPFMKRENLLEYYFEQIASPECGDTINVLGQVMSVDKFLGEVTNELIAGVAKLDKVNEFHQKDNGRSGRTKIIEGFLDAKYPNYAIYRGRNNKLILKYFDLFPAHLMLFERPPTDSNGHTQYEIFDEFYQRDNGIDSLVNTGMIGAYVVKLAKYSKAEKMLAKMAASAIEMLFQKDGFHKTQDILFHQKGGRQYELFSRLIIKINKSAPLHNLRGEITLEAAIEYWRNRVKTNMLLRLALDFLEVTGLMTEFDKGESSQALSASSDEAALMEWARGLYQTQPDFVKLASLARKKQLPPDVMMSYFRGMIEQYVEGPDFADSFLRPKLEPVSEELQWQEQRPIGVEKSSWYPSSPVKRMRTVQDTYQHAAGMSVTSGVQGERKVFVPAMNLGAEKPDEIVARKPSAKKPVLLDTWFDANPHMKGPPLIALQKDIQSSLLSVVRARWSGVVITRGLYSSASVTDCSATTPDFVCQVTGEPVARPAAMWHSTSARISLVRALARVWELLLKNGKLDDQREQHLKATKTEDIFRLNQHIAPWEQDLPTKGSDNKIQGVWLPLSVLRQLDAALGLPVTVSSNSDQEEYFLQVLTVAYNLKIVIDDADNSGLVYLLESYRLGQGLWAALYTQVPRKDVPERLLGSGQVNTSPWLWLQRSYHSEGVSWHLRASSFGGSDVSLSVSAAPSPPVTSCKSEVLSSHSLFSQDYGGHHGIFSMPGKSEATAK